ncbi:MAG: aminoacyl-tRNA hydrolase [Patescibacteria group bacterium]
MTTIVGLGNPGSEYRFTRHNIGFMVVDSLLTKLLVKKNGISTANQLSVKEKDDLLQQFQNSKKHQALISRNQFQNQDFLLIKPQTFMNDSGLAVRSIQKFLNFEISRMFVVHDDLDLEIGNYKVQYGKGPKIHNGLSSIYQHLKTQSFWHVRIGVDGRGGRRDQASAEYVLSQFLPAEKTVINQVIDEVVDKLLSWREL